MALRRIKVNGRRVWQARVAYRGLRKAAFRPSKEAARDAEAELLQELKAKAASQDQVDQAPATHRQLFEYYLEDLEARGKGADTVGRAAETQHVIKRLMPELLERPVSRVGDAELYAFRQVRLREGKVIRERIGRRSASAGARRSPAPSTATS